MCVDVQPGPWMWNRIFNVWMWRRIHGCGTDFYQQQTASCHFGGKKGFIVLCPWRERAAWPDCAPF